MKPFFYPLAIAWILVFASIANGQERTSLESQIETEWKSRWSSVKSVDFKLICKETIGRGFQTAIASVAVKDKREVARMEVIPENDTTIETLWHVILDGDKVLIDFHGPKFVQNEGYKTLTDKVSFNGKQTRRMNEFDWLEAKLQGHIQNGKVMFARDVVDFLPLLAWLGPIWSNQNLGVTIPDSTLSVPQSSKAIQVFDRSGRKKMWLNPAQGFAVTRITREGGPLQWVIDIEYEKHPSAGWFPRRWNLTHTGGGGNIKEYELIDLAFNPIVDPEVFEIEFPPGTFVLDYTGDTLKDYLIKEDGTRQERPIKRNNFGERASNSTGMFFWANVAVVVTLATVCTMRAIRNLKKPS